MKNSPLIQLKSILENKTDEELKCAELIIRMSGENGNHNSITIRNIIDDSADFNGGFASKQLVIFI